MSDQIEFSIVDEERWFKAWVRCPYCGGLPQIIKRFDFVRQASTFYGLCLRCKNQTQEVSDARKVYQIFKLTEALTRD